MAPDVEGMLLVAVSPHTLAARPVVLGPGDTVSLTLPDAARSAACVVVDGDMLPCRASLDRVEVRTGPHDVRLVRLDGGSFFETARDTFFGG